MLRLKLLAQVLVRVIILHVASLPLEAHVMTTGFIREGPLFTSCISNQRGEALKPPLLCFLRHEHKAEEFVSSRSLSNSASVAILLVVQSARPKKSVTALESLATTIRQ